MAASPSSNHSFAVGGMSVSSGDQSKLYPTLRYFIFITTEIITLHLATDITRDKGYNRKKTPFNNKSSDFDKCRFDKKASLATLQT